jgi:hypothetical protein
VPVTVVVAAAVVAGCGAVTSPADDARAADTGLPDSAVDARPAPTATRFAGEAVALPQRGYLEASGPFAEGCGFNEALTGLSGALAVIPTPTPAPGTSILVSSLRGECGALSLVADGSRYRVATRPGSILGEHGAGDAGTWALRCPDGQLVVGFDGRAGNRIDQLIVRCAAFAVDAGATGDWVVTQGPDTVLEAVGGLGGRAFDTSHCPPGQVATALGGLAEDRMCALGLICQQLVVD